MPDRKNGGPLGLQISFFLPLWRRFALIGFCVTWSIVEFVIDSPVWGVGIGALAAIAVWQFFFDGWPDASGTRTN